MSQDGGGEVDDSGVADAIGFARVLVEVCNLRLFLSNGCMPEFDTEECGELFPAFTAQAGKVRYNNLGEFDHTPSVGACVDAGERAKQSIVSSEAGTQADAAPRKCTYKNAMRGEWLSI